MLRPFLPIETMTAMVSPELLARSKDAEQAFEAWLRHEHFSYLAICQDEERFAPLFSGNLKRPDFLVLLESIGMIAVDVKSCTLTRQEYTLPFEDEFRRAITFERLFRLPVWYAYWNLGLGFAHWISALKAIEVGVRRTNAKDKKGFIAINLCHFEMIRSNSDIGKLYTHRLRDLSNIKIVASA